MARTFKCHWQSMLILLVAGFGLGVLVTCLLVDTNDKPQPTIINVIVLNVKDTPTKIQTKPKPKVKPKQKPKQKIIVTGKETINGYVHKVCKRYKNVSPELIKSIIYQESRYRPNASNGNCVGLMQLSMRWHKHRAKKLGVSNLRDPYGNILVGVDYISELTKKYKDPALVLMLYNMRHDTALALYKKGKISSYAKTVLARRVG